MVEVIRLGRCPKNLIVSSWTRLPLFGLASAKNWVLLANYIDTTHLGNAIALKAGRLLDLPFTHHAIPVEVTVNKEYMGLYLFTEHKEVKEGALTLERTVFCWKWTFYLTSPTSLNLNRTTCL